MPKHSQYFFRQPERRQLHPLRAASSCDSPATPEPIAAPTPAAALAAAVSLAVKAAGSRALMAARRALTPAALSRVLRQSAQLHPAQ
jgi:hypothetical protein